jgi:hypothetical protein
MKFNRQNNNSSLQSAGNRKGSSETTRQFSNVAHSQTQFASWLAGVVDGDGNFSMRVVAGKLKAHSIRIKLHLRDVEILNHIQNQLQFGKISPTSNKPYCIYRVSKKKDMSALINMINGQIRLKVDGFKKACNSLGILYCEADYKLKPMDPYFAGLVDTDGSIVFNYAGNRIECGVELKLDSYSQKLNFEEVIPGAKPSVAYRTKTNQSKGQFQSISFKYQTVKSMVFAYQYFNVNPLYGSMKSYRVSQIKRFLILRHFRTYKRTSLEWLTYKSFLLDFIRHSNPKWHKTPFIQKLEEKI